MPAHVILPTRLLTKSGAWPVGQTAGWLARRYDPFFLGVGGKFLTNRAMCEAADTSRETAGTRSKYGATRFGQSCLLARRLVEAGSRFITINTASSVFEGDSWDVHGTGSFGNVQGMQQHLAPAYDLAVCALIDDLQERGLLDDTLVCSFGEFGRTPRLNPAGGRDHWPQCWTVYFAGGGVQGGRVVGRSDSIGSEPADRPVGPAELVATIYHCLGLDLNTQIPGPEGRLLPIVEPGTEPVWELF
jgi:uncharacterized protein (DUF1501 family)